MRGVSAARRRARAPGLGRPRVHLRRTDSTNERARALAIAGAPHGTLVTAAEQTAGRGRAGAQLVRTGRELAADVADPALAAARCCR